MLLALALIVNLVSSGTGLLASQFGRHPDLQPTTCKSSDGRWVLAIDPTHRDGSGPGNYRCTHDGKEIWAGEKPWTFWEALITDDGFVAGYSYSKGGLEMFAEGEFHAIILAPDGSVKLDESHEREGSRYEHMPPDPRANGLFCLAEQKRVVFRIADVDINRNSEEWWCYQLPDAKAVFRRRPREFFPEAGFSGSKFTKDGIPELSVCAVRAVRGTQSMVIEWRLFDYPAIGVALSLHDADLKSLWSTLCPGELNDANDAQEDRILSVVYRHGTLLESPAPATFAVGLPRTGNRVDYVVERGEKGLLVREAARQPWKLELESDKSGMRLESVPQASLKETASIELQMGASPTGAVHDIATFAFAAPDVLRFVRNEAKSHSYSLLRVDMKGAVLAEQALEIPGRQPDLGLEFWELGPHSWLATQSPYGEDEHSLAWKINEQGGVVTRLDAFSCASVDAVAPLDGDAFVALATKHEKYTMAKGLFAFGADGQASWHVWEDMNSEEPSALFSPEALAVTTDRHVVVLDVIRHTLQYFGSDGHYERTLDLDKAIGHKAEYPSGLQPDIEGGLLVHDFNGTPPLHRMKGDGSLRASLSPHFPDGRVIDGLTRNARVAPDGRLWATDGQRLFRMDEHGIVDLQVGTKVDTDVLADPSASAIDVFGRVLVQDGTTGAVHVFDGKGKRLFVCRPEATDFKDPDSIAHLAATKDRGVIAAAGNGFDAPYIEFHSDGSRKGRLVLGEEIENLVCSPVGDARYAGQYGQGFVRLDDALKAGARFERAPDGFWLEGAEEPAIGPDGAVAVVSGLGIGGTPEGNSLVLFDSADPAAGRAIEIPADARSSCLALGRKWAVLAGYGNAALLVRRQDGKLARFSVPNESKEGGSYCFGFDPETGELLAFDSSSHRLHRYAMP